jgi:heme exporter protein CcmD
MDFSAAHVGFVEVSYGLTGLFLLGLIIYVLGRDRVLARKVKLLKDKAEG